jgi:hypothetical protein
MPASVTGVTIENYRSIASCNVKLQPLTLLVGPNGAGKSNFLDTLRFLVHSMHAPLEQVVEARYGIRSLLQKLPGGRSAESFRNGIDFNPGDGTTGAYSLTVAEGQDGAAVITEETCSVGQHGFTYRPGKVVHTAPSHKVIHPGPTQDPLRSQFQPVVPESPTSSLGFVFTGITAWRRPENKGNPVGKRFFQTLS